MQAALATKISDPAQLIQDSVLIIRQSAVLAFKYYNYATNEDEISDICRRILLLPVEDHYRWLRLFDSRKSSFQNLARICSQASYKQLHTSTQENGELRRPSARIDKSPSDASGSDYSQRHESETASNFSKLSKGDQQLIGSYS